MKLRHLISIFRIGKDRWIPVRRSWNKPWNEKDRERKRDVHQKELVGEQEVYKSLCRPIRPRKTFRDLRPTNETVPLKFFHACITRTTPRLRSYAIIRQLWNGNEERSREEGGEKRRSRLDADLFSSFMISRYFLNFFFFSFFVSDCLRYLTLKILEW